MDKDIQTFIIWKNARVIEYEILEKIRKSFKILKEYEITWTPSLFGENLSAFYGDNFIYNLFQRKTRGEGPFVFVIVEDEFPNYITVSANRGNVSVNEKTFMLKKDVRGLLNSFAFHASNDLYEARCNIALLLGKSLDDFMMSTMLDGSRESLKQDIPCVRGWRSLSEFFYILNETCTYVLLRGFDAIPDTHTYAVNGDIDLLVDDMKRFLAVLNPRIPTNKNIFHFFNWEDFGADNRHLLIHPKFVGDNYYDIEWQKKILATRLLNEKKVYVPSDEMYFWSLLYHGVFHKENWWKYNSVFESLAPKIGVDYKSDKGYLCKLMTTFLKNNGYEIAAHLDNKASSLILDNIKDDSLLKETTLYCYKTLPYSFVVFSERAIFYEPELVTEFVNKHDIFPDMERHVLDKTSSIYNFLKNREKNENEYLWNFSRRNKEVSVFTYRNSNGKKSLEKHFIGGLSHVDTEYITYNAQSDIPYCEGAVKYEDELLKTYIDCGKDLFLKKLEDFVEWVFARFYLKDDADFLNLEAWDCLPRNVFFFVDRDLEERFVFFDTEAEYKNKIRKSYWLAILAFELERFLYFNTLESYTVYFNFIKKYKLDDIWLDARKQRDREIAEICFNQNECLYEKVEAYCSLKDRNEVLEKRIEDLYQCRDDLYRCRDDLYKRTDDLYRRLDDISLHTSAVENQNALMQKSVSWHLGRAITYIPRKLISLGAGKRL